MDLKVTSDLTPYQPYPLNVRCPSCQHVGTFHGVGLNDVAWISTIRGANGRSAAQVTKVGIRQCPNRECRSVLFFGEVDGKDRITFPPEVLDFDGTNLPKDILASLEEAIKCHAAGCYRASALMVRRVLEELCNDKNANGKNLKDRIAALKTVAVIPDDLLAAADELRLLGNDAAHIEAKDYDDIGKPELEVAIDLAKELLKAVYQYTSLVRRLTALKKQRSL